MKTNDKKLQIIIMNMTAYICFENGLHNITSSGCLIF